MLPDVAAIKDCSRLFPHTIEGIIKLATSATNEAKLGIQKILQADTQDWNNVVRARDDVISSFSVAKDILGIVKETAIASNVRSSASQNYLHLEKFFNTNFRYNMELKNQFCNFVTRCPGEYKVIPERQYYVEETMETFRHLGLDAPGDQFEKIQDMNAKIQVLSSRFDDAISADNTKLVFAQDELEGCPADVLENLQKDSTDQSKFIVGLDYPTYFAIQRACVVSSTRETLARAFEKRAFPQNSSVLRDLLCQRRDFAKELKFENYAAWDLFRNMVGTNSVVSSFLSQAIEPLQRKWRSELRTLLETANITRTSAGKIKQSDLQFMIHQYKSAYLNVDENAIREYFPVDYTIPKIFEVLGSFFDVEFLRADCAEFWSDDVFAMTLICKEKQSLLGHIILDLYPRENKYGHACCSSIVPSYQLLDKTSCSPALAVILANFPKKTSSSPGLLLHSDVATLLHEIGHALHAIWGRCEMTSVAAYNVKMDFIEVPSQFLEEWAWDREVLQKISSHYRTGDVLPEELINAKLRTQFCFAGFSNLRQILLGMYSLHVHQDHIENESDLDERMKCLWKNLFPEIEPVSDSHFACSFGHLSGYGASYYSYHYSKAFAIDVLHYVKGNGGLFDPKIGNRYKDIILGKAGSLHPSLLMKEFLGREPNLNAFWKHIGIDSD